MPDSTKPADPRNGDTLTPRETELLELVTRGLPTRTIAEQLGITPGTVKAHLTNWSSPLFLTPDGLRVQAAKGMVSTVPKTRPA